MSAFGYCTACDSPTPVNGICCTGARIYFEGGTITPKEAK